MVIKKVHHVGQKSGPPKPSNFFLSFFLFFVESFILIERAMSHIKEWKKFEDLCISHSIDRALLEQAEARERFETESCCTRKCGYYFMLCPCIRHHTHGIL